MRRLLMLVIVIGIICFAWMQFHKTNSSSLKVIMANVEEKVKNTIPFKAVETVEKNRNAFQERLDENYKLSMSLFDETYAENE